MPKVSIIIRTKNEERWIGHCLSMVFKQDYDDFEVVLVDNDSTDNTLAIASRYPIAHQVNIKKFKPGLALNKGIRISNGDFIVLSIKNYVEHDQLVLFWLVKFISNCCFTAQKDIVESTLTISELITVKKIVSILPTSYECELA